MQKSEQPAWEQLTKKANLLNGSWLFSRQLIVYKLEHAILEARTGIEPV